MTGGALLLAWLEPLPPADAERPGQDSLLIRRLARRAVGQPAMGQRLPWTGIEILPCLRDQQSAGLLTATLPRKDLHFLVGADGLLQSLPAWQRQDDLASRRMIRVGVVASPNGEHIPRAQWIALRALLAALEERIQVDDQLLPIQLVAPVGGGPTTALSPIDSHLKSLLSDGGFLG